MTRTMRYRTCLAALLVLALPGADGLAQPYVGPGSTVAGDYLRGVGIAAWGMGSYNLNTAQADQINAQTFIMLNEYMWNVAKNENRENWEHRKQVLQLRLEYRKKIQERIHDHPEGLDVMHGDALTAVLRDIMDPKVDESSSRYAKVQLEPDVVRRIPFKLGEKGETFSMNRLSLKSKKKWAVAFQFPQFNSLCLAYQDAVDNALVLAIDSKQTQDAIEAVEKAVNNLEDKVLQTPYILDPINQRLASEARTQLDNIRKTARLFKTQKIQLVLAEIDKGTVTSVNDLRLFMRRHNLTFAEADTPDERTLYPELYQALVVQREKSTDSTQQPQN
jgi:hypothetical protein